MNIIVEKLGIVGDWGWNVGSDCITAGDDSILFDDSCGQWMSDREKYGNLISAAPEMLEALIEACTLYEYSMKVKYHKWGVGHEDYHRAKIQFEKTKTIVEKVTGKTWAEIKELL